MENTLGIKLLKEPAKHIWAALGFSGPSCFYGLSTDVFMFLLLFIFMADRDISVMMLVKEAKNFINIPQPFPFMTTLFSGIQSMRKIKDSSWILQLGVLV